MEQTQNATDIANQLDVVGWGQWALEYLHQWYDAAMRPWNAYQLLIAVALFALAHLLRKLLTPHLETWMRSREGWPMSRMRWFIVIRNRLRLILFVILIGLVYQAMRQTTWPSRSYLLGIIADLGFAWLIVAFATRLITNAALRSLARIAAWTWITLQILGLTDVAQSFLDSVAINLGDLRISVWLVLQAAFIIGVLFFLARLATRAVTNTIQSNEDLSPSMRVLSVKVLQLTLYGAAFFVGLKAVGVDLTGLAVLSGAIGVGLGFGLQKVVSNLVSGVIILLDKSIKPGDVISLGETFGWIQTLGARYASVVTRDGKEYLIPNEDLITGQVVNWSHSNDFVRIELRFGASYSDSPHEVRRIAIEAAKSVDRVLANRDTVCHITGFGDSSIDYVLRFWIKDPTMGLANIKGNVFLALWDAFQANGISIPFPQREVRLLDQPSVGD